MKHRSPQTQIQGQINYARGMCAEVSVSQSYQNSGYEVIAHRWRDQRAEIDLVTYKDNEWVFIEVKSSKNPMRALNALGNAQIQRIRQAAVSFLTKRGLNAELQNIRFDVAIVSGDGKIEQIEAAF